MGVVELLDYKLNIVEKICQDKFENDIMLVFNNFTDQSIKYITNLIKIDISKIENKGVIFDSKLLKITCTMYLGIAWSMYKKGKRIQKEKGIIQICQYDKYDKSIEAISNTLKSNNVMEILNDIVIRYFTLYLSRHLKDMIERMDILYQPKIKDDKELKKVFLENLKNFAIKILSIGIIEESKKTQT